MWFWKRERVPKIIDIGSIRYSDEGEEEVSEISGTKWKLDIREGQQEILYQDILVNKDGEEIKEVGKPYKEKIFAIKVFASLIGIKLEMGWVDIRELPFPVVKVLRKPEITFKDMHKVALKSDFDEYDFTRARNFEKIEKMSREEYENPLIKDQIKRRVIKEVVNKIELEIYDILGRVKIR